MRVFFFGDSITQGFYDTRGGWVQHLINEQHQATLKQILTGEGKYVEAFNLGVSGDTANGVLKRIESEVTNRRLYEDDDILVIAIGVNDATLRNNIAQTDEYEFEKQIEGLAEKALSITNRVLFIGLAPVDETLTNPLSSSNSGKQYKNNRIDLFEDIVKQVASRKKITFVPVYDILSKEKSILADGLHPNDNGHQRIAELVRPKLEGLLNG